MVDLRSDHTDERTLAMGGLEVDGGVLWPRKKWRANRKGRDELGTQIFSWKTCTFTSKFVPLLHLCQRNRKYEKWKENRRNENTSNYMHTQRSNNFFF